MTDSMTDSPHSQTDGSWTECKETGLCDHCFTRIAQGDQVLICAAEEGPAPRKWEAYCSTECRDARQVVLGLADRMEAAAAALRG